MESDKIILVVAIDLGTSGSGYAFSFRHEFDNNPLNISTYEWTGSAYKTPSSILIKSDFTFDSFGNEAEDRYKDLCDNGGEKDLYFLQCFKMQLYKAVEDGEDVRKDFNMKDITGKKISGKLVFSLAIGYFRNHVLQQLDQRNTGVPDEYISWVITVPAIWTDACKQFTRESAEKAGVRMENFSLVYEPEAASIFGKALPLDRIIGENNEFALRSFDVGRQFIVIDGGGGTVDISAQEVSETGQLNTIHRACGGPYGGEFINQEFRKLLIRIIGGDVLREFKEKYIWDYTELMKSFETKKKTFIVGQNVVVRFPVSLSDILLETTGCSVIELIQDGSMKDTLKMKRDKLFIEEKVFKGFFAESIKCIVEEIRNVLENPRCSEVSTIMLVGGFSESEIIRSGIRTAYPEKEIFIPKEGGLAVLKGAVLYGHNPKVVSSRTCNHTYGVAVAAPFQQGLHDPEKLFFTNGEELCDDIFHNIYTINELVNICEKRSISLTYKYEDDDNDDKRKEENMVEIFVSDKKNPMYVTEEGTRLHAVIYVQPPGGLWPPISQGRVELEISGTELIGTYIDKVTGSRTSAKVGFLPNTDDIRKRLYDPESCGHLL